MTKILFGGLKKDSNLRIRSENYYISNGPLYNFPNRNLKLDQCAWPMSCSTHNFTNFLFTSNLLSILIGRSKHEDSVNISFFADYWHCEFVKLRSEQQLNKWKCTYSMLTSGLMAGMPESRILCLLRCLKMSSLSLEVKLHCCCVTRSISRHLYSTSLLE